MTSNSENRPVKESHYRSIIKGISWRIIASIDTFFVAFLVIYFTEDSSSVSFSLIAKDAFKIAGIEFPIKLFIYYVHERIWQFALQDGVVTKKETLYKTFSWRFFATLTSFLIFNLIMGKEFGDASIFALIETFTKLILFYFHERLWLSIPLGSVRSVFNKELKS